MADVLFAFGLGCILTILFGDNMMWVYAFGVTLFLSADNTDAPKT